MNTRNNPDLDPDHANDNDGAIAPASKASALASTALTALVATFKTVDTTPIGGRSVYPLMQFKSRDSGVWAFGQQRTIPEPNSLWAVNPASFMWGWVCWGDANKTLGEKLVSISEPLPDDAKLPVHEGFPWDQEMAVNLKCISGTDAGVWVTFKTNTVGGKGEITRLIEAVRDRLNGPHEGKVWPIVRLENSSYPHPQYGKTFVPVMTVADWMSIDGPAPASEPAAPQPTQQPRKRRVG
jgi:hypothetical protein